MHAVESSAGARCLALSLPPGFVPPRHAHPSPHLAVILAGALEERNGRSVRRHGAGAVRLAPAGDPHVLRIGPEGLDCMVVELDEPTPWRVDASRVVVGASAVVELARAAWSAARAAHPGAVLRAALCRGELAARARRLGRGLDDEPPSWLRELRAEIAGAPERHAGLRALAARSGVHPVHAARAFRDHFGLSIGVWQRAERLARACALLVDGARPVAEVAGACGFADQAHLTRALRSALGTTPARLRRAHAATLVPVRPSPGVPR